MLHELNKDLVKCEQVLFDLQPRYAQAARSAANARYVYDMAWADGMLAIKHDFTTRDEKLPTAPIMEAMTTQRVAQEMKAVREAEAELDGLKKHIDTTQSILSSIQTRAKLAQIEAGLS